jgi:hypothetical protein
VGDKLKEDFMPKETKAQKQGRIMGQIIAKAWTDDVFKQRLVKNATAVLKEEGIDVPMGLEVKAVANTDKLFHLVVPQRPGKLTDKQIEEAAKAIRFRPAATDHPTCDLFGCGPRTA